MPGTPASTCMMIARMTFHSSILPVSLRGTAREKLRGPRMCGRRGRERGCSNMDRGPVERSTHYPEHLCWTNSRVCVPHQQPLSWRAPLPSPTRRPTRATTTTTPNPTHSSRTDVYPPTFSSASPAVRAALSQAPMSAISPSQHGSEQGLSSP